MIESVPTAEAPPAVHRALPGCALILLLALVSGPGGLQAGEREASELPSLSRVYLLLENGHWDGGHAVRMEGETLQIQPEGEPWRAPSGPVREIHFRPRPFHPEPFHAFPPDTWETVRRAGPKKSPEVKNDRTIFHDRRYLATPMPDPPLERVAMHLLVSSPENQYYLQWRVLQGEKYEFARNSMSISTHGRTLTLQGAGPRTGSVPLKRKRMNLPPERGGRQLFSFYFDASNGRCLLYINGRRQEEWFRKGERDVESTGLRVNDLSETGHPLHLHRTWIHAWPENDPATTPAPKGEGDHLILMNGDVLTGRIQALDMEHIELILPGGTRLSLPTDRVYRVFPDRK